MRNTQASGTLYIVATPLGNLEDITFRAVDTLKQVDLIAAEDTRHSKKLLSRYGIQTPLVSCHEHNETEKTAQLILKLKKGQDLALISDAGTPCISDPGYTLVNKAGKENIRVVPIPGCCAAIAGMSVSGLPTDAFVFLGFLPRKQQQLKQALDELKDKRPTLVIYESPKRILKLLETILEILGDRDACLAREMTKLHEEFIRGPISQILGTLKTKERVKGEIALFVAGSSGPEQLSDDQISALVQNRMINQNMGTSELAGQLSKEFNLPRKKVYNLILRFRDSTSS